MKVVTRFAPSPTGMLHIGSGRTALFNYYFAKRHGGTFLLRIEDTDRARSTPTAVDAILSGMAWLGMACDGEPLFQLERAPRHVEIAHELVRRGGAYFCYMSQAEIEDARAKTEASGKVWHYDRRWRDRDPKDAPVDVKPVIRIKAPMGDGALTLKDEVQGDVTVRHDQLDDFILLRNDGTPTYMLAVVVDDYDMSVTHVIRGDDHLNNMFRQYLIYQGMSWAFPLHAHVPLIHGEDGKKLSKRKGAASIEEYRELGYLPEAMRNYLLRLGWSHGDDEIISDAQASAWFDLEHVGQSPSQWDFNKLNFINHHYIKLRPDNELIDLIKPVLEMKFGPLNSDHIARIRAGIKGLKERSKTLLEMATTAEIYIQRNNLDNQAEEKLAQPQSAVILAAARETAHEQKEWGGQSFIDAMLEKTGLKMGQIGPVLRLGLTGSLQSPDMTEVISALGRDEVIARLSLLPS